MALLGDGAVAIWHDIAPEGLRDFYAWHGGEHMPERVAIPGFLRGRRYVALDADLGFFNLYEATDTGVVAGPDYKARLDNPTPWTVRTVKHFRDVHRSICRVAATAGAGDGGLMATWRYEIAEGAEAAHEAAMKAGLLATIGAMDGVAGAHLLIADRAASGVKNAEERARGQANRVPGAVLMVEGWGDVPDFTQRCDKITAALAATAGLSEGPHRGLYRLQATANKGAA